MTRANLLWLIISVILLPIWHFNLFSLISNLRFEKMVELTDPDGLVNLESLINRLGDLPDDKSIPIVFVPGFSGWGSPLFGAVNYWGGIENVPDTLMKQGYTLIIPPIAPFSSNWERACELYRLLTIGRFSIYDEHTTDKADNAYDVDIDYGKYYVGQPKTAPIATVAKNRKRAILFTLPENRKRFQGWTWNKENRVHFICHSQGGTTARYLVSLMQSGSAKHQAYFKVPNRDDWIISVTTLGSPHQGSTVIDVFEFMLERVEDQWKVLSQIFATVSFTPPEQRAYDLQLDHWGICRQNLEPFHEMQERFMAPDGPVATWYKSKHTGFYDNSIKGVEDMNLVAVPATSSKIFYFSFSFSAIQEFPTKLPDWAQTTIAKFPFPGVSTVRGWATSFPPLKVPLWFSDTFLAPPVHWAIWKVIYNLVSLPDLIGWITQSVAAAFLATTNYHVRLPAPGKYLPRDDIIPFMAPTCYGMASLALTAEQKTTLLDLADGSEEELGDWFQNDGIVNTQSMKGPRSNVVKPIKDFPYQKLASSRFAIANGVGPGPASLNARGVYWHFGTNTRMDHADEIGVFIDEGTKTGTAKMYENLVQLITRLPLN